MWIRLAGRALDETPNLPFAFWGREEEEGWWSRLLYEVITDAYHVPSTTTEWATLRPMWLCR